MLESQAFGHYDIPDYSISTLHPGKPAASLLRQGETLQHNLTGADALIAEVGSEALPAAVEEEKQQQQEQQDAVQSEQHPHGSKRQVHRTHFP